MHVIVDLKFPLPSGLLLLKHGGHVGALALMASAFGASARKSLGE